MEKMGISSFKSEAEVASEGPILDALKGGIVPEDQLLENLGLFLTSKNLSRLLFLHDIYKMIVPVQGVVFDFGTRWGQNMVMFVALRGIYEPFNRHRKIVGFDTFSGFPSVDVKDGTADLIEVGNVTVTDGYSKTLEDLVLAHEKLNPCSHLRKTFIVEGDASETVPIYMADHPETIVALAFFDFDIYKPTLKGLKSIKSRLVKGSVVAFDELNDEDAPGETLALLEVFGLESIRLQRPVHTSRVSYFVVE